MRKNIFVGLMLAGVVGTGCSETNQEAPASATEAVQARALGAGPVEPLDEDSLATQAYERVQAAFSAKQARSLRLGAYSLQPVGDAGLKVKERARALGLEKGSEVRNEHGAALVEGSRQVSVDAVSGAERYVDTARFHTGKGVSALPMEKDAYISRARSHMQRAMPEVAARNLRSYRLRQYMNESAGPMGERPGATVYQVAVAFHETLDGLPVIGPGGKVAVHMTPAGEVISHESTARAPARRVAEVSGEKLLAPEEARKQVEARLATQGVRMADYRLSRAELGYLRLGRNSTQSLLVPHYAYVYEPASQEILGKKRVEVIPAVTDPALLQQLRQDEEAETARKAARMAHASPEQRK
jgi:hypothetical protein